MSKNIKWLATLLCITALLCLFVACDDGNGENETQAQGTTVQVPIYQGMTVSNEAPEVSDDSLFVSPHVMSLSSMGGVRVQPLKDDSNNGNHYGNDKGNNKEHETGIADVVENEFPAVLPEDTEYFAKKNEDIYIYIHISNPAKYEILSFTLNGKKYSSYMFEAGSDMETLILKYNVGDVEGTQSYTIDAIKYVDGEQIKDVRMEGDRTIQVHIYPEEQPTISITEMTYDHISLTMTPTVTDPLGLIADSQGELYVMLFEGKTLVDKQAFVSGETVTFEGLVPDASYEYAVVAVYDAIDGQGRAPHMLYQAQVRTEAVVSFEDVTVEGLTATFTLSGTESITALGLYEGETLLRELALDARQVDHLPIDKEVSLVATYTVGDKTYTTTYTLPVIKESEGLLIVNGVIAGIGSCTDTTLYLNHPIGKQAFIDHSFICEAYIGDGVTGIGTEAFRRCTSLTYVEISDSVTNIGDGAFRGCEKLVNISIPDNIKSIGNQAFAVCPSLKYNEYDNAYYLGNSTNPYIVLMQAKSTTITSCEIHTGTKIISLFAFQFCTDDKNPYSYLSPKITKIEFIYSSTKSDFALIQKDKNLSGGADLAYFDDTTGWVDYNGYWGYCPVHCTDGDYVEVIGHLSFDELRMIDDDQQVGGIFTPGESDKWDGTADLSSQDAKVLQYWGWVGCFESHMGTFGFQIGTDDPIFDDTFTVEAEELVISTAQYYGCKTATRIQIDIDLTAYTGTQTVQVLYKDTFGIIHVLTEFTAILP